MEARFPTGLVMPQTYRHMPQLLGDGGFRLRFQKIGGFLRRTGDPPQGTDHTDAGEQHDENQNDEQPGGIHPHNLSAHRCAAVLPAGPTAGTTAGNGYVHHMKMAATTSVSFCTPRQSRQGRPDHPTSVSVQPHAERTCPTPPAPIPAAQRDSTHRLECW